MPLASHSQEQAGDAAGLIPILRMEWAPPPLPSDFGGLLRAPLLTLLGDNPLTICPARCDLNLNLTLLEQMPKLEGCVGKWVKANWAGALD